MPARKKGRRLRGTILVGAVALIADLIAIAAAEAVTTKFPQPLRLIQYHPWWSVAIFSLVGIVLGILLYLHDNAENGTNTPPSGEPGNDDVKVDDSVLKKSWIWVVKGARVRIAGSKLKDSPIIVSTDSRDDPTPGNR